MIIRNKKTQQERIVSVEEWALMKDKHAFQNWKVVDSADITAIAATKRNAEPIKVQEILNFKKNLIEKQKAKEAAEKELTTTTEKQPTTLKKNGKS